jgi:hypothetical protein
MFCCVIVSYHLLCVISERVSTTVTLLLAISALYIVVFANIPMVGYLTKFDLFVLFLFSMLFLCCCMHQLIVRLQCDEKLESWPLRRVYIRFLELLGRLVIIPCVCGVYAANFSSAISKNTYAALWASVIIFISAVGMREVAAVKKVLNISVAEILVKIDSLQTVSTIEVLVVNAYLYRVISRSLKFRLQDAQRQREQKRLDERDLDGDQDEDHSDDQRQDQDRHRYRDEGKTSDAEVDAQVELVARASMSNSVDGQFTTTDTEDGFRMSTAFAHRRTITGDADSDDEVGISIDERTNPMLHGSL